MATVLHACSPGNVCETTQYLNMENFHCKIYHQPVGWCSWREYYCHAANWWENFQGRRLVIHMMLKISKHNQRNLFYSSTAVITATIPTKTTKKPSSQSRI